MSIVLLPTCVTPLVLKKLWALAARGRRRSMTLEPVSSLFSFMNLTFVVCVVLSLRCVQLSMWVLNVLNSSVVVYLTRFAFMTFMAPL